MKKIWRVLLMAAVLLVLAAILFPVFATSKMSPSLEARRSKTLRYEKELRLQKLARRNAVDLENAGHPARAEEILRKAYGHQRIWDQSEKTGRALLALLIRRGEWTEAAAHMDRLPAHSLEDLIYGLDLDVAAQRPDPKKYRARWREKFMITEAIKYARQGNDRALVKRLERRLALFPITPMVARAELRRGAARSGLRP